MDAKLLELKARKTFAFKKTFNEKKEKNTPEYQQWREAVSEANRKKHADPDTAKRLADANRKSAVDPVARKNRADGNRKKAKDPAWQQKHKEGYERRWADPEERIKHKARMNAPDVLKATTEKNRKLAKDPVWREKVANNNKAKRTDSTHLKKHQAGVTDRSNNNEGWIRKNCRPVSTPYGIFQKAKDVMDLYHAENGGKRESVAVKLRSWLKSDKKPDWNYLTWEEYDRLKEIV
jgi:hypothetical protein